MLHMPRLNLQPPDKFHFQTTNQLLNPTIETDLETDIQVSHMTRLNLQPPDNFHFQTTNALESSNRNRLGDLMPNVAHAQTEFATS
jgi:hypothetical protein